MDSKYFRYFQVQDCDVGKQHSDDRKTEDQLRAELLVHHLIDYFLCLSQSLVDFVQIIIDAVYD